jgi:hypothetical protein
MKELAKQKKMEFEQNCYFPDKMLKDILGMSPNPNSVFLGQRQHDWCL